MSIWNNWNHRLPLVQLRNEVYFNVFINYPESPHPRLCVKPTHLQVVTYRYQPRRKCSLFHKVPDQKILRWGHETEHQLQNIWLFFPPEDLNLLYPEGSKHLKLNLVAVSHPELASPTIFLPPKHYYTPSPSDRRWIPVQCLFAYNTCSVNLFLSPLTLAQGTPKTSKNKLRKTSQEYHCEANLLKQQFLPQWTWPFLHPVTSSRTTRSSSIHTEGALRHPKLHQGFATLILCYFVPSALVLLE